MARVDEVAADLYRICVYVPALDLQFNHFLVRDDEPLLFHAGLKGMFPEVREAVATVIEPSRLRWIGFSHFESDECGALNHWLEAAPQAEPLCSAIGARVSVNDFALRPAKGMMQDETLVTGKYRFRFCSTAHLPHGWDAGLLFEETNKTLLCSDLFHHNGDGEPLTEEDVVERSRISAKEYQAGPLANYVPYTPQTEPILERLAALEPRTLAVMHGSSFAGFAGDGAQALRRLATVFRDVFGETSGGGGP